MIINDVIKKEYIIVPLKGENKNEVIEELVAKYATEIGLSESEEAEIANAVKDREILGSTALENGIAIPHAKLEGLKDSVVVIGILKNGIDFGGDDLSKVFFLVLAPQDKPSEHIQLLSCIAKLCISQSMVKFMINADSPEEVYELFFD